MPRKATIYQTWHGEDMALSDTWHPTMAQARNFLVVNYGARKSDIILDDSGNWDGEAVEGYDIHLCRLEVEMTKGGICDALTHWPNR